MQLLPPSAGAGVGPHRPHQRKVGHQPEHGVDAALEDFEAPAVACGTTTGFRASICHTMSTEGNVSIFGGAVVHGGAGVPIASVESAEERSSMPDAVSTFLCRFLQPPVEPSLLNHRSPTGRRRRARPRGT